MKENIFELILADEGRKEMQRILSCNEKTAQFGLVLSQEETGLLLENRKHVLREQRRVEFGESILPGLIEIFCDSQYINQMDYLEIVTSLQEVFYLYKNESQDQLTDEELLNFMKEQFEGICFGSIEYLSETCLERFGRAIRAGYCEYQKSGGKGEYGNARLSEEQRWDKDIFFEIWNELIS